MRKVLMAIFLGALLLSSDFGCSAGEKTYKGMKIGDVATVKESGGFGKVFVAVDGMAMLKLIDAINKSGLRKTDDGGDQFDEYGLTIDLHDLIVEKKEIFLIPDYTKVRILQFFIKNSKDITGVAEIRILEGEYIGETGVVGTKDLNSKVSGYKLFQGLDR